MKNLERRIEALEGPSGGANGFAVVLAQPDEQSPTAIARWESENGPVGLRSMFLVRLVSAQPVHA